MQSSSRPLPPKPKKPTSGQAPTAAAAGLPPAASAAPERPSIGGSAVLAELLRKRAAVPAQVSSQESARQVPVAPAAKPALHSPIKTGAASAKPASAASAAKSTTTGSPRAPELARAQAIQAPAGRSAPSVVRFLERPAEAPAAAPAPSGSAATDAQAVTPMRRNIGGSASLARRILSEKVQKPG